MAGAGVPTTADGRPAVDDNYAEMRFKSATECLDYLGLAAYQPRSTVPGGLYTTSTDYRREIVSIMHG